MHAAQIAGQVAPSTFPANDFQIVASKRVGPIYAGMTPADLRRVFGSKNVIDKSVRGAEGAMVDASLVFPNTIDQIEVRWSDETRTHIETVRLSTIGGHWRAGPEAIYVGIPLSQLVLRNSGKAIRFSGFDWDYGGYVTDWGRGRLSSEFGGKDNRTSIRLGYSEASRKKLTARQYRQICGDQKILSSTPVLRLLQPFVSEISVYLAGREPGG